MAVTVKWDPVDGARASATFQGWEIERKCMVTGLTPAFDMLITATNAALADAGYAGIGASYGSALLPNTFLEEWQPTLRANTNDTVDITFVFRQLLPNMTTDIGTSLSQETSCFDKDNAIPLLTYNGKTQKRSFSKFIPESSIVITRLETSSPGALSKAYVGKVNSGGWSRDPGAAARTWLCMSITGQNRGTGIFLVTYVFAYREDTWDEVIFYLNDKGVIPGDVPGNDTNAIKRVQKYKTANFNNLNLGA